MGTAFEVALICDLKPNLPPQIVDTLNYLTRSQDYDFEVAIKHPFFEIEFDEEWRNIIANNHSRPGEEYSNQACRNWFDRNQLCFRVLLDDDTFFNIGFAFLDWLALLSSTQGLVGYYIDVFQFDCHLIYLRNEQSIGRLSSRANIPVDLMHRIDTRLGGSSWVSLPT